MKLAVTAMVRDEADIITQWVDYHLAQGVDVIIVTDNASTDGTTEILQAYEAAGSLVLHHDHRHEKQQGEVVTRMAREAAAEHGADWVVNADADEFIVPVDRSRSLKDVFEVIDPGLGSFGVRVVNLLGPVAESGAGFERLVWRDGRSNDELRTVGVLAQPTTNAVHVGDPDVTVVQGNHLVSITSHGAPPPELALEVLHLPWRSWRQFEHKVEMAGAGYEASPHLRPSPNHHGMRDYARLKKGVLLPFYAARHPLRDELDGGPFTLDRTLPEFFAAHAIAPGDPDIEFGVERARELASFGRQQAENALELDEMLAELDRITIESQAREAALLAHQSDLTAEIRRLQATLDATNARKVVRLADAVSNMVARPHRS